MSLWWKNKDELDEAQLSLIDHLPIRNNYLIVGPPGCGKTNVLLRRAQFVKSQNMPRIMILTFTRALTEFVKTGSLDEQNREIFPSSCINTIESWLRSLYKHHDQDLPTEPRGSGKFIEWKKRLAKGALAFLKGQQHSLYDALFIDEAQDLLQEEVEVIRAVSDYQYFVGDDSQKIYAGTAGLEPVKELVTSQNIRVLQYHYRTAKEICVVADRIPVANDREPLASTCHYRGPEPATVTFHSPPQSKNDQISATIERLQRQVRVYEDLLDQGDRIGIFVAQKEQREEVLKHLNHTPELRERAQIVRSRYQEESDFETSLNPDQPICILTVKGCKGLEFRTVHWLFADDLPHIYFAKDYYTAITRAKTSIDIHGTNEFPTVLALAHAPNEKPIW